MGRYDLWKDHNTLRQEMVEKPLFEKLKNDLEAGSIFCAFRKKKCDFYYRGRKLFSYDQKGFRTNLKYAVTVDAKQGGEVYEADLEKLPIQSRFFHAYDSIKQNIEHYVEEESNEVAALCSCVSPFKPSDPPHEFVALDIELSLFGIDRDGQDRIDLVLLDRDRKRLCFLEVKLLGNRELQITTDGTTPVIGQLERYRSQLEYRKEELIKDYCDYVAILNDTFNTNLPLPESCYEKVNLLILGFDRDERRDHALPTKSRLEGLLDGLECNLIGSAKNIGPRTIRQWFP